ncbi:MAG: energy transducer TonB [Verrucomicrobiae bacterium]|nr:energy transducer TonB [Verrucomicrobiae bacterium]
MVSIVFSVVINLLLIWLLFSFNLRQEAMRKVQAKAAQARRQVPQLVLQRRPPAMPQSKRHPAPPRTFLETDSSQAVKDTPQDAKYYSEHNTVATQTSPSPVKSEDIPLANGNNTKTMATATALPTPRLPPPQDGNQSKTQQPSPAPTPPSQAGQQAQPNKPQPPSPIKQVPREGDLAILKAPNKPETNPQKEEKKGDDNNQTTPNLPAKNSSATKIPPSPSSNRQVLAAKSRLDGGVQRTGNVLAFNSAQSPFASYDKKIIAKIGAYFVELNRERVYGEAAGEVEVSFKLLADGTLTELQVTKNSANAFLAAICLQVLEKSGPFDPFPDNMKAIAGNFREGEIRFIY